MQECKSPSVGIWWFYYGDVIYADPVEVENGLQYIFALGENFTSEQKENYLIQLQKQKTEIERQIEKVQGKKQVLVRLLEAQYEAEQKADLHSVPKLTEELTRKILEDTDIE